jgi:hypothetical protein
MKRFFLDVAPLVSDPSLRRQVLSEMGAAIRIWRSQGEDDIQVCFSSFYLESVAIGNVTPGALEHGKIVLDFTMDNPEILKPGCLAIYSPITHYAHTSENSLTADRLERLTKLLLRSVKAELVKINASYMSEEMGGALTQEEEAELKEITSSSAYTDAGHCWGSFGYVGAMINASVKGNASAEAVRTSGGPVDLMAVVVGEASHLDQEGFLMHCRQNLPNIFLEGDHLQVVSLATDLVLPWRKGILHDDLAQAMGVMGAGRRLAATARVFAAHKAFVGTTVGWTALFVGAYLGFGLANTEEDHAAGDKPVASFPSALAMMVGAGGLAVETAAATATQITHPIHIQNQFWAPKASGDEEAATKMLKDGDFKKVGHRSDCCM